MDELTTTGETEVSEWKDGLLRHFTITPEAVNLPRAALADLRAARPRTTPPPSQPARRRAGPYRDVVLLNAAAALLVGDAVETLREGIDLAAAALDDGRARATLARLVAITNVGRRMSDILASIAAYKREEVADAAAARPWWTSAAPRAPRLPRRDRTRVRSPAAPP
jgi:hypothetical protein